MEFFIDWLRIQPVRRSGKELWSPSDKVKTSEPRAFGQIITPHNSSLMASLSVIVPSTRSLLVDRSFFPQSFLKSLNNFTKSLSSWWIRVLAQVSGPF